MVAGLEEGLAEASHIEMPAVGAPLGGFGDLGGLGAGAGGGATVNVYPSAGMDEEQLAALVSRELAWATAGGLT
jgi:hypothetical protein